MHIRRPCICVSFAYLSPTDPSYNYNTRFTHAKWPPPPTRTHTHDPRFSSDKCTPHTHVDISTPPAATHPSTHTAHTLSAPTHLPINKQPTYIPNTHTYTYQIYRKHNRSTQLSYDQDSRYACLHVYISTSNNNSCNGSIGNSSTKTWPTTRTATMMMQRATCQLFLTTRMVCKPMCHASADWGT